MVVSENILPDASFDRAGADLFIVYDGECPFCSRYVALQRLRESIGKVSMVNARDHLPDVAAAKKPGRKVRIGRPNTTSSALIHHASRVNDEAITKIIV